ncbi:MAG: hypothetical protein HYX76_13545 [Acidobacteria bacterium]|nr:hypothetical protein [Acidobacteriota bacterium]
MTAVYLPDIGRGFIKDDFAWMTQYELATVADAWRLFGRNNGFYRPVVGLTFGLNRLLFETAPMAYGLTNLLLLFACAWGLTLMARSFGLSIGAAFCAAGLWLLNPHGINMALLWISGRTALLVTLFSLAAVVAVRRDRQLAAATFALFAMLAKEEAVVLPLLLVGDRLLATAPRANQRHQAARLAGLALLLAPLVVYFMLRLRSGAMTPSTAPPFYTFTYAPGALARNVLEYLDRTVTFPIGIPLVLSAAVLGQLPAIGPRRYTVLFALAWIAGTFSLTLFLPVRSSLYVVLPSVGSALIGAMLAESAWTRASARRRRVLVGAVIVLLVAAWPAYRARNARWVDLARLSAQATAEIRRVAADLMPERTLVFQDDRSGKVNLDSAFGTLLSDAVALTTGKPFTIWVEPPLLGEEPARGAPPAPETIGARFQLIDGRLCGSKTTFN